MKAFARTRLVRDQKYKNNKNTLRSAGIILVNIFNNHQLDAYLTIFINFLLRWYYYLLLAKTFSPSFSHLTLSRALHRFTPIDFKFLSTSSNHLLGGLPPRRFASMLEKMIFFVGKASSCWNMWLSHLIRVAFIIFQMLESSYFLYVSWL